MIGTVFYGEAELTVFVGHRYGSEVRNSILQWWLMAMICGDPETRHVE